MMFGMRAHAGEASGDLLGAHLIEAIRARCPDVLAITGPQAYESVMSAVHEHLPKPPYNPHLDLIPSSGLKLTPRHYAYLKIAEGCDHKCTFCIIPDLRGRLQSRPIGQVMREATNLVKNGVKELLIVAQDTAAYGADSRHQMDNWNGVMLPTPAPQGGAAREVAGPQAFELGRRINFYR